MSPTKREEYDRMSNSSYHRSTGSNTHDHWHYQTEYEYEYQPNYEEGWSVGDCVKIVAFVALLSLIYDWGTRPSFGHTRRGAFRWKNIASSISLRLSDKFWELAWMWGSAMWIGSVVFDVSPKNMCGVMGLCFIVWQMNEHW